MKKRRIKYFNLIKFILSVSTLIAVITGLREFLVYIDGKDQPKSIILSPDAVQAPLSSDNFQSSDSEADPAATEASAASTNGNNLSDNTSVTSNAAAADSEVVSTFAPDKLYSPNAILMSLSDDMEILLDKNSEDIIYPASLTKIMTAIVAIENSNNLNDMVLLPSDMFDRLYKENASMAGFLPEEQVSITDLLYGALLPSGAECCIGLADYITGSEEDFVALMNEKAQELGMNNTHFTNVTGLHDPEHYTTVKDLAVLLEYALKNDTFRRIFTSERHAVSATNKHPAGFTMASTMFKSLADSTLSDGEILGGKTGYTGEAGLCLASLARIGNREFIFVSAGAEGDHQTDQYNILDAINVYSNINIK